jgi:hypothetical protein
MEAFLSDHAQIVVDIDVSAEQAPDLANVGELSEHAIGI